MLQNAYFLAKIGADTAENEQHFAEILPKTSNYPARRRQLGVRPARRRGPRAPGAAALPPRRRRRAWELPNFGAHFELKRLTNTVRSRCRKNLSAKSGSQLFATVGGRDERTRRRARASARRPAKRPAPRPARTASRRSAPRAARTSAPPCAFPPRFRSIFSPFSFFVFSVLVQFTFTSRRLSIKTRAVFRY